MRSDTKTPADKLPANNSDMSGKPQAANSGSVTFAQASVTKKLRAESGNPRTVNQSPEIEKTNTFNPVSQAGLNDISPNTKKAYTAFTDEKTAHYEKAFTTPEKKAPVHDYTDSVKVFATKEFVNENDIKHLIKVNSLKASDENKTATENAETLKEGKKSLASISGANIISAKRYMKEVRKRLYLKTIIVSTIASIMLVLTLLFANPAAGIEPDSALFYLIASFILLLLAVGTTYKELHSGLKALRAKKANADTALCFIWLFAVVQSVLAFSDISAAAGNFQLFSAAAVFSAVPVFIAKSLNATRALITLNALPKTAPYSSGTPLPDSPETREISENMLKGGKNISRNSKTAALGKLLAVSLYQDGSLKICSVIIPIALIISIAVGAFTAFKSKDFIYGFSVASGSLCFLFPSNITLSLLIPLFMSGNELKNSGASILTYSGAAALADAQAVILDAESLFDAESCAIHAIKPYNSRRIDISIIYAASLIINSKGALSEVFKNIVLNHEHTLPPLEYLGYEDKLGLSAVIEGSFVLLGTLEQLSHHSIELPKNESYNKYADSEKKPLYLCIDNELAAMFLVSYSPVEETAREILNVTANAVTLLISSYDPNITEEYIEKSLKLDNHSVRVINQKYSEYYKTISSQVSECATVENFNNGSALSFLKTINASHTLKTVRSFIYASAAINTVISLIIISFYAFFKDMSGLGSTHIILYQTFWCFINIIVSLIISTLKKK